LEAKVFDSLKKIDSGLWNSVVRKDNIISSWEHLIAVEESHINDCNYRYVMIYDNGKPVANACFYYISFDLDIFNRGAAKKIIGVIRKIYSRFLRMRVIECGTPTAMGNTVNWIPGQDPKMIFEMVVEQMKIFAKELKVGILIFRDFIDSDLPNSENLLKFSFKRVGILPNAYVINNWKTFGEYMNDLASKYKMSVRRYMRILELNSVEVKVVSEYAGQADRLLELWRQCYDHSREYQREVLTREYFVNMSNYMKGKTKLLEFIKDGKIIGYSLAIKDVDTFHGLFAGMDYDYVRDSYLLFNLYGHTVKLGIEEGAKIIEMGLTTTREKLSFGSVLVPMFAYMRHLSPVMNPILSNLFVLFSETSKHYIKKVYNERFYERIFIDAKVRIEDNKGSLSAEIKDLSLNGARISADGEIKKGHVMLEFVFQNSLNNFKVPGRVVWINGGGNNKEMGVIFLNRNPAIIEKIRKLMHSLDVNLRKAQ
jgi:predicted N-acyltransferase